NTLQKTTAENAKGRNRKQRLAGRANMNEGLNNQTRHEPQKKKHALRAAERQVVAIAKVKRDGPDPPDDGEPVPDDEPVDLPQPRHQRRTQNHGFDSRLLNGIP